MPHATAINPGQGTVLKATIASTLTQVAQMVTLSGPNCEVESIDKTLLTDTKKRYRPGLPDGGEVSGTAFYDPNDPTHLFMFGLLAAPAIIAWELVYHDAEGTKEDFSGFLTKFERNGMEVNSNLGVDFTIKLDGLSTQSIV